MIKTLLYFIFIVSIIVSSVRIFHVDEVFINTYNKYFTENIQKEETKTPERVYSFSERIQRGDSYFKQAFIELAQDEYLEAIKQDTNNIHAYTKLASAQALLKNYQAAIQNLQHALTIQNSPETHIQIAYNYIHLFEFDKAKAEITLLKDTDSEANYIFQSLLILESKEIDTNIKIGKITEKQKRLKEAFDEFKLYKGGQNIFLKALVSKAFIDNKDFELALTLLEKILKERSDYRDAWIMQGYAYLNLENYEKAKTAYEHAYDLDTTKAETQYFLAITYEETGNKDQALEFYKLAYKNQYNPKVQVIQKIAELSLEFELYAESFRLYEEFLKLSHDDVDSFIRPMWIAIDKLNDLEKAEGIAEWAREIFPQQAQSYNLLAWVEIEKNNLDRASSYLQQAFAIDPLFAAAHLNQGEIYEKQNKRTEAIASYEQAYQNDKDGPIGSIAAQKYNDILKK